VSITVDSMAALELDTRDALRRYGMAALCAAIGLAVTWLSSQPLGGPMFMFQFAAVAAGALYGGLGPGLATALLSGIGFYLAFFAPGLHSAEGWRLASFAAVSVLFALFADRLRRSTAAERAARLRAESARRDAEAAEARAKAIGSLQERLVAVVSHDLRNPLGAITMSASALQRTIVDPRQARQVARITASAGRMQALIHDLLEFARCRSGDAGIPVRRTPERLGEICRRVLEEFRAANPDRSVNLTVSGNDTAELDADRVEQVVANLVANALKHGFAQKPVDVLVTSDAADAVRLEVRNEGPPIPADLMPQLFEPFSAGDAPGSVGLGLFIVRQIAAAHGGTVSASSTGTETLFAVTFPRREGVISATA
jgi:signal transduction histidine kinase